MVGLLTWVGAALCGALGAVARYRVDALVAGRVASDFPYGTLAVNLSGSLALGVLVGASVSDGAGLALGTGFLGGYTTFSTWMVESVRLGELGDVRGLLRNLWLSLLAGFVAAAAGFYLGQALA